MGVTTMFSFLLFKSLRNRKFISLLCVLSIALSVSLYLIVGRLKDGIETGFTNSISNADLIVGARSGPLQLLLYTIFHIGSPTNNITYKTYKKLKENPMVDWTIPISLGDSYRGYRVVATDNNFFKYYQFYGDKKLELGQGQWSFGVFDVVLGSKVASDLQHKLGDALALSHGVEEAAILKHDNTPFRVTGILKPTGTPVDKSLYITLYGMEAIHVGMKKGYSLNEEVDEEELRKENLNVDQITAFILRTKNRFALLRLQRYIATYEKEALSAIIPAMALTELWKLLDQIEKAFLAISFFVIIIGLCTILIALYMSLNERKREMAILRSVGASPFDITILLILEASLLSLLGAIVGLILQYGVIGIISPYLESQYSIAIGLGAPNSQELVTMGFFVLMGSLFGLIPAIKAYKVSLNNGLSAS